MVPLPSAHSQQPGPMLVILLSGNIDAVFGATLAEEIMFGVVVQENVNIAFDFLGCRPINLAVLFEALLLLDDNEVSKADADCEALAKTQSRTCSVYCQKQLSQLHAACL